jgi:hypothetical protein
VLSPLSELEKVTVPMTWSPMYDGFKFEYWYLKILSQFSIKILSFSKTMSTWLEQFPIPVLTVHYYYLTPDTNPVYTDGVHIFFWFRGAVTFDDIKPLLDTSQINSFTIIEIPDAKNSRLELSAEDVEQYKISHRVESFLSRENYLDLVRKASVFIAPRKKEGIGAFTEALMLGKCVIAYDDAVHNEYITNGEDGFLFTGKRNGLIDLSKAAGFGRNARARAEKGHAAWIEQRVTILPFMQAAHSNKSSVLQNRYFIVRRAIAQQIGMIRYYASRLRSS